MISTQHFGCCSTGLNPVSLTTNNIIMTIKELYIFAINNSLLDEEVSIVVSKYHEEESKVIQPVKSLDLNKVEYTFDDLIALFT